MEFTKRIKIGILVSIIIVVGTYHLYVDDELNPEAKKWIEYYSKPTNLEGNAFIGLIALSPSNDISTEQAKELYKTKLGNITKGSLDYFQQLKYPNVSALPDIFGDDEAYFCEFNKDNCLSETAKNRVVLEEKSNKLTSITKQYRSLSKLTNFEPLNSIATEPDWDSLIPIQRLAFLEVYFHILDNDLELAALQLSQLISVERKFLRNATEAVFHAVPIVNFELYYQPLLLKLKEQGFANWEVFGDALTPLPFEEISMNRMWLIMFAQGTRALQFKYIAERAEGMGHSLHGFQAQIKYKENMTLNSIFAYQRLQLISENAKKENLISLVEIADREANAHSEKLRSEIKNMFWFTIKNYRNIVGSYLKVTALPKFLSLYGEKFKLDLRLLLLNMVINEDKDALGSAINLNKYVNPYTGEAPKLSRSKLCYTLQNDKICIDI
ncbi:hypothetical protein [Thalassotalea sp. PLHSN55]|uniref:hypothetical protein n=1 Tax=Thalassotalea sp. PLHSN55 TaxID=3435888 RepID=UPI003F8646DC